METMENPLCLAQDAVSLEEQIEIKTYADWAEFQQSLDDYYLFLDGRETEGNIDY